mgnify:CR=1 FL=1
MQSSLKYRDEILSAIEDEDNLLRALQSGQEPSAAIDFGESLSGPLSNDLSASLRDCCATAASALERLKEEWEETQRRRDALAITATFPSIGASGPDWSGSGVSSIVVRLQEEIRDQDEALPCALLTHARLADISGRCKVLTEKFRDSVESSCTAIPQPVHQDLQEDVELQQAVDNTTPAGRTGTIQDLTRWALEVHSGVPLVLGRRRRLAALRREADTSSTSHKSLVDELQVLVIVMP